MDRMKRMPYQIRWARRNEWVPAMEMIWKTFRKYEGRDFTEEGIQHFFDFKIGRAHV